MGHGCSRLPPCRVPSVARLTPPRGEEPWGWERLLVPKRCRDRWAGWECILDLCSQVCKKCYVYSSFAFGRCSCEGRLAGESLPPQLPYRGITQKFGVCSSCCLRGGFGFGKGVFTWKVYLWRWALVRGLNLIILRGVIARPCNTAVTVTQPDVGALSCG